MADIAASQLPRDRPLWDLTVVEGLERGLVAFVVKLHHSVADGGAAVALLENAFVVDDTDAFVEAAHPEPLPTRNALLRHALADGRRRTAGLPQLVRRNASGYVAARRATHETEMDLPVPFTAPRTSLNVSLDAGRTFAMTSLPLDDLLAVKRAASATLNDVFLALCGGALRSYLLRRGELPARSLVAGVPLATQPGLIRYSGNHVDNLMLSLATDVADPWERIRVVHEAAVAARHIREELGTELFEDRAGLTPPLLYPLSVRMWARTRLANRMRPPINLIASNVRGPDKLPDFDGSVVTALYSVGPILEGIGLNITAWSYRDRLYVSVLGCPGSLPDPWELIGDIDASAAL